ncbi:RIKEN cDNA 1110057H19, putative [Brugia malayi]|uniref:Immediate early response 3-interacting protein 1 n=1 Tax=Brugia malayi TaxID=6279 RepID=A0A0J9Y563_BRUMA|nr:RIKEN cDNA 1110057H19, putative [Brugia malayi]CDQ01824.1 Bm6263 [Brugia malayi]VIO97021.1 RIKEN cDNA 1110057H19, putative [Brugia malayi]
MFVSFYGLLEAGLLILNGIAVLNKERFLNKVGLSVPSNSFEVTNPSSFKMQLVNLIAAVQTVMRVPLIAINIVVIVAKLLFG